MAESTTTDPAAKSVVEAPAGSVAEPGTHHPEHTTPPLAEPVPPASRSPSLEEGEIPQSPASHQRARLPPNTQQPTGRRGPDRRDPDRRIRSAIPSPEPQFNEPQDSQPTASLEHRQSQSPEPQSKQPQEPQPTASLKRKQSTSNPPHLGPSTKKQKEDRKTCVELGDIVVGFISIATRGEADEVARHIHDLPVPQQVSHRLILYGDACLRGSSAAVGIV